MPYRICASPFIGRPDPWEGPGISGCPVASDVLSAEDKLLIAHMSHVLLEPISVGIWFWDRESPYAVAYPDCLASHNLARRYGLAEVRLQVIYVDEKRYIQLWTPATGADVTREYGDPELCTWLEAQINAMGWPESLSGQLCVVQAGGFPFRLGAE